MDIELSWDLFIAVFFVIVVAYSLIIGRDNTIKVILGSYVALVCADAIGGLMSGYFGGTEMFAQVIREVQFTEEAEAIVFLKVITFLLMVILFAVKGAFNVSTARSGGIVGLLLHFFYAVCSAGLIISAVLILVSGISVLSGGGVVNEALSDIMNQSFFVTNIIYYHNFWFAVPAVAFLLHSLRRVEG